jgi:hypothetical protein
MLNCAKPTVLARIETHWHAPWLIGALSHQGTGHAAEGSPNQDAFAIGRVGDVSWMAVADGVSTKPLSQEGSQLAVTRLGEVLGRALMDGAMPSAKMLTDAYKVTHKAMAAHAKAKGQPVNAYACTLLAAIVTDKTITVAKIGDGSVLSLERCRDGSSLVPLIDTPHVGEGVVDLTHAQWINHLKVRHIADRTKPDISTVALCTDGADPYFFKTVDAHDPARRRAVLNPDRIGDHLVQGLAARGPRNAISYFASLLFLKPHVDESDDKTLIVATIPAEAPPCSPTTD